MRSTSTESSHATVIHGLSLDSDNPRQGAVSSLPLFPVLIEPVHAGAFPGTLDQQMSAQSREGRKPSVVMAQLGGLPVSTQSLPSLYTVSTGPHHLPVPNNDTRLLSDVITQPRQAPLVRAQCTSPSSWHRAPLLKKVSLC